MTRLTITICAADDHNALRVVNRLMCMMDVYKGENDEIHLNDAGYTSGHMFGNGEVVVTHTDENTQAQGLRPQGEDHA